MNLPDFRIAEQYILSASRGGETTKIEAIRASLFAFKAQLDYNMSRFIDQFGQKLDVERDDVYHKFVKVQSEKYSEVTRMFRVLKAYNL